MNIKMVKDRQNRMVRFIFDEAVKRKTNNCVTRQQCLTNKDLDEFDKIEKISPVSIDLPEIIHCYGCNKDIQTVHGNYVYSCKNCGDLFQRNRYLSTPQKDKVAVVTGIRTKLYIERR
jgi:predicted RNA-binding Zn-ribbon protein involved in translation (DUF1610 family)